MEINLKQVFDREECRNYKEVVSKYGIQVVCDEEDERAQSVEGAYILPDTEECKSAVQVASKVGYKVVCSDEDE